MGGWAISSFTWKDLGLQDFLGEHGSDSSELCNVYLEWIREQARVG